MVAVILLSFVSCKKAESNNMASGDYNGGMNYGGASYDELGGENYTEIVENSFVNTAENNTSYFSIDANTASYPNLRSMIKNGYPVSKDAVRIEEMLNYFNYDYQTPTDGAIFSLTSSMFDTHMQSQQTLVFVVMHPKRKWDNYRVANY